MNATKVKICGLTRIEDVKSAVSAGADAVGFVFTRSPRQISIDTAIKLVGYVPEHVLSIGLFMNQTQSDVADIINQVPLDVLQFHGDENQAECDSHGLPWLKAVAMENDQSAREAEQDFPKAMGLLLDSHTQGRRGGSGKIFDWSLARPVSKPVWLAGGLNVSNVSEAIRVVRPYAVDVSSGVESAPGIKDRALMKAFITAVKAADKRY